MTLLHQMAEVVRDLRELEVIDFWVKYKQVGKNEIIFTHSNCVYDSEKTIENAINEAFSGYKIEKSEFGWCITYEISCQ